MHIVVVCPKCEWARIAEEGQKTAVCPRCGYRMEIRKMRIFFRGTREEAMDALGRINASIRGGTLPKKRKARKRNHSLVEVIMDLEVFTAEDLCEALDIPPEKAEDLVERLLAEGWIYLTSDGRYRYVG